MDHPIPSSFDGMNRGNRHQLLLYSVASGRMRMFRDLKAIEIAEGALLADIAVLFQLLSLYLPIGGQVFRLLVFIVFTVLVLRRGLYVGIMGLFVAVFVSMMIVGTHSIFYLLLECMCGLFLGTTMKRCIPLLILLLVAVTF